jgi:hypothetical protein
MIPFISVVHGATAKATAQDFVTKINEAILFPVIALLMAVAFIVFLYGAFIFVKNANNEAARETGRNHLIYGVIGMLVMLSAFAILSVAANTFGLGGELENAQDTSSPFAPETSLRPVGRGPVSGSAASSPVGDFEGPSGFGSPVGGADDTGVSISDFTNGFVPQSAPAQPYTLTPTEEESYQRYVEEYAVDTSSDEVAVLEAYADFGVTEILFMVPIPSMYTQSGGGGSQAVGSLDQQEALCAKSGGGFAAESGQSRVTSVGMYLCLK